MRTLVIYALFYNLYYGVFTGISRDRHTCKVFDVVQSFSEVLKLSTQMNIKADNYGGGEGGVAAETSVMVNMYQNKLYLSRSIYFLIRDNCFMVFIFSEYLDIFSSQVAIPADCGKLPNIS